MSLTALELELVVAELQALRGAHVDAVRVHAERALTLELRGRSGSALLLLCAEPEVTRLHVASARPAQPDAPFAWQAPLRQALEGSRLEALELRPGDRVVTLRFERAGGAHSLVAELTGRHGNLFLVDAAGVVRYQATRAVSATRPLGPGLPWTPPPPASSGPPHPPRFEPVAGTPFPWSLAVERRYAAVEAERALAEGRRRLREPLRAAMARSRRALEKLAEEAARVPAAEADRRAGDLLKANLHAVARGASQVTLTEWTEAGPTEVTVALDPALTPRQNMERCYRRFKRIVESAARVEARTAEVRSRLAAVEALLARVDAAPPEGLAPIEREARRLAAGPRPAPRTGRRRRDQPLPPYRTFRSLAGLALLVGRGAAENDQLTRTVARGNDLWLHARGLAGAHVVIRLGGRTADQESLLDAAHLAAHFSDARGEPQVEVACTLARFVKKGRGAAPGAVTYSQERMLHLRVEPARVARLLAEEEGTPP
jgi:predicted ribosome quality control (RQC) complex YloA/Tae2 family protein